MLDDPRRRGRGSRGRCRACAIVSARDDLLGERSGIRSCAEAGPLAFTQRAATFGLMLKSTPERDEFDHPSSSAVPPRRRHPDGTRGARGAWSAVRRRAAPDREDARPRAVDDLLPRSRPQPARSDERGQVAEARTTESSRPRSSGTVTLESVGSACRAAEYAPSVSTWERTLSARTSPPGSSSGRASAKSAS